MVKTDCKYSKKKSKSSKVLTAEMCGFLSRWSPVKFIFTEIFYKWTIFNQTVWDKMQAECHKAKKSLGWLYPDKTTTQTKGFPSATTSLFIK